MKNSPQATRRKPTSRIMSFLTSLAALFGLVALIWPTLAANAVAVAQNAPTDGPRPNPPSLHALTNARVITQPGELIEDATILFRDGVIEAVGPDVVIPADARVWDLHGDTVHAGFIDLSVSVALPDNTPDESTPGRHWNRRVHPEVNASNLPGLTSGDREQLRTIGFTAALIGPDSGIFRGSTTLMNLANANDAPRTYIHTGPQITALETSGWGSNEYPGALIGTLALMRQTFHDAEWHRTNTERYAQAPTGLRAPQPADALDALRSILPPTGFEEQQTIILRCRDELDVLRCAGLVEEFGLRGWIKGSGSEFRRLEEVAAAGLPIILPLAFARAPQVASVDDADAVSLRDLMQWEQEPTNPRRLINAGVTVAFTTESSEDANHFLESIRFAIREGLTEEQALEAMTTTPAIMTGLADRMGTIAVGKAANLVIVRLEDELLFGENRAVQSVWIDGNRYELEPEQDADIRGDWAVEFADGESPLDPVNGRITLQIEGEIDSLRAVLDTGGEDSLDSKSTIWRNGQLSVVFTAQDMHDDEIEFGWDRVSSSLQQGVLMGEWVTAAGKTFHWTATPTPTPNEDEDGPENNDNPDEEELQEKEPQPWSIAPEFFPTPLGAFGRLEPAFSPETIFIHNATIWTGNDEFGVIEDGDMIVRDGKITEVGTNLDKPRGAYVIDGTGKHITAGLIDCHSHTGISRGAINEGTQAITAEVRINDVINPDDINWYRELAGGLTAANQLHGSANPIGGQNSVVKLRWGQSASAFRFENAIPGIKFALGENVKQANWGDKYTTRYPQTRMGVEQLMRSAFAAARDYQRQWSEYNSLSDAQKYKTFAPARDLELDTLVEILDGKRLVHCHSYRQDEILMLVRLADEFGFTIGTFQHILEGYKVAQELADHGAGASGFSDWWAYKFEVYDAIPYNGSILHETGVLTSFNSDSNELARRMNLEGAKAIKYGNVSPADALDFVSLNPAKQLRIDAYTGSLESGKDADFVIWSGDPMSTLTRCEETWIDGSCMFSLEEDAALRVYAQQERTRIIQKLLAIEYREKEPADDDDNETQDSDEEDDIDPESDHHHHAMTMSTYSHWYQNQLWQAQDSSQRLEAMGQGVCGCDWNAHDQ